MWKSKLLGGLKVGQSHDCYFGCLCIKVSFILLIPHPLECGLHLLVKAASYNHSRGRGGQEVSFYGMSWEVHTCLLVPSHGRGITQSYGHTAREAEKCSLQLGNHMHAQLKLKGKVDMRSTFGVCCKQRGGSPKKETRQPSTTSQILEPC